MDRPKDDPFLVDEHPRPNTTEESLARLRPVFVKDGTVTPGNSSGINDGAASVVLMSEKMAKARGLTPRLRLVAWAVAGIDPEIMGYAPALAIPAVLDKAGLTLDDIDLIELNEAFAAQAVAVIRDAGLDPDKTNVSGGAIALGHPVGATGGDPDHKAPPRIGTDRRSPWRRDYVHRGWPGYGGDLRAPLTVCAERFAGDIAAVTEMLAGQAYLADRGLSTAIYLSLTLSQPLLLEGEAGVGKTEVAKALAGGLGVDLIRLQCYEGIDAKPGSLRVGLPAPTALPSESRRPRTPTDRTSCSQSASWSNAPC